MAGWGKLDRVVRRRRFEAGRAVVLLFLVSVPVPGTLEDTCSAEHIQKGKYVVWAARMRLCPFPAGGRALKLESTFAYASCVECVMQTGCQVGLAGGIRRLSRINDLVPDWSRAKLMVLVP